MHAGEHLPPKAFASRLFLLYRNNQQPSATHNLQVYHLEINFVIRGNEDKLYMTHANVRAQLLELKFATQVRSVAGWLACGLCIGAHNRVLTQAEIDEGTDVVADQIHDIIDRASGWVWNRA